MNVERKKGILPFYRATQNQQTSNAKGKSTKETKDGLTEK